MEVRDQLDKVRNQLSELEKPVNRVEQAIQKSLAVQDLNETHKILDWASDIPFQKHFRDAEKKVLAGTGQWLSQDACYTTWHNCSRSQILWLHGIDDGESTDLTLC